MLKEKSFLNIEYLKKEASLVIETFQTLQELGVIVRSGEFKDYDLNRLTCLNCQI